MEILLLCYFIVYIVLLVFTTYLVYKRSLQNKESLLWLLVIFIFQVPGILVYFLMRNENRNRSV